MTDPPRADDDASPEDAAETAYQAIRRAIIDGVYPAGSRLPEEELTERIQLSRTPIRQALRQLEHEGHVEVRPRRGAWVSSWSADDIAEVYDVRAALESHGARIAAQKIGALEIRHLEEVCVRMELLENDRQDGFLDDLGELNNDFHTSLLRATGNRRLMTSLAAIVEVPLILRVYLAYDEARRTEALRQHREIVAAITRRDPDWAEAAMRVHILSARAALLTRASS